MDDITESQPHRRRFQRLTKAEIALFAAPILVLILFFGVQWFQARTSQQSASSDFSSPPRVLMGHTGSIWAVTFSPDSKIIASSSDDSTVRLWDAEMGISLFTLTGHKDWVMGVAFSPDGRTLASGSPDNTVRLWDVSKGTLKRTFLAGSMVRSVAFSPDGQVLAAGSNDWKVRLWSKKSGKLLRTLTGHKEGLFSVVFSPDGQTLASGDYSGLIHFWNVKSGKRLRSLQNKTGVFTLDYSPNGRLLAVCAPQSGVRVWDMQTLTEVSHWKRSGDNFYAQALAFAPDNNILAVGSNDIELCDARSGARKRLIREPKAYVHSVAFSPDGKMLVSGNDDGTVKMWRRE